MSATRDETRGALRRMLANGPLTDLPRSRSDLELLLALAAASFEPETVLSEKDVNDRLREWLAAASVPHGIDHVTLRRCLVDWRFLVRDKAGSGYRLAAERIREAIADEARGLEPRAIVAEVRREREKRKREHAGPA
jgi:hypothetical protein